MINIQDEVIKIHHQYGTTEMSNYQIQLLCERYAKEYVLSEKEGRVDEMPIVEKGTEAFNEAKRLKKKFGDLAYDVASEIYEAIKHEDNKMYSEILFWISVKKELR